MVYISPQGIKECLGSGWDIYWSFWGDFSPFEYRECIGHDLTVNTEDK